MKKSLILSILSLAFVALACSPEEFDSVSEGGIPSISDAVVTVDVDQSTNVVTFHMEGDGLYPVWIFSSSSYVTENPYEKTYASAGTYTVEYQVGNRNGLSLGTGTVTFTLENTLTNYDRYTTLLSDREWRIDNSSAAHLACGESGTDGTNWWSASADEKAGTGLYDNRIYFTADYEYTFDPGDAGTVFVNYGCTVFSAYTGYSEDFAMPAEEQTATYSLSTSGEDVYLSLASNTYFPYISTDDQYQNPKFRFIALTASKLELVYDSGDIAWHFLFTSAEAEQTFDGYNSDSEYNLWNSATKSFSFYYAPGWSQIADPTYTEVDNNTYTFSLPSATYEQWQAQCFISTNITTSSANTYDFSAKFTSTTDISNVTVKLYQNGDDNTFYFADNISLAAYEETLFYKSEMAGIDMSAVNLVLDFGGNPDNTEVTVADIDLQIHGADGVYAPSDDTSSSFDGYTVEGDTNMWNSATVTPRFWYADTNWNQIADPTYTADGNSYTFGLATATSSQWQAQCFLDTDLTTSSENNYDFSCKFYSTQTINNATVKLYQYGDDGTYYFVENITLTAYEDYLFYKSNMEGIDISAVSLCLDFGGNPDNTEVTVYDIVLQTHGADGIYAEEEEDNTVYTYDSDTNLWKTAVDDTDSYSTFIYYAPGWAQIDDFSYSHSGNTWNVTLPYATTDTWQAQFHITPTNAIAVEEGVQYDFCCTVESTVSFTGVTVKLTDTTSDDNYLMADRFAVTAYEAYTYKLPAATFSVGAADAVKLVFDFAGCADNTEITITDIVLQKTQ